MAAGLNVAANISAYVNTIWEDALLDARDNSFLPALIRNFNDRSGTAIRTRSDYGTVTYGAIGDADDLTSQTFTPSTGASLTPYEYGAQFEITDLRAETDIFNVMEDARQELGLGAAESVQQAITAQFASLTGGTVGSAGGTLTHGDMYKAVALLKQRRAPEPYVGILNPGHWFHVGTAATTMANAIAAGDVANEVARRWFLGNLYGVNWYLTNDVLSGTAAKGAVFSRDALAYDLRRAFRIEPERNASKRAWELNATMVYATGVWRPTLGVQIIATSVVPTS